MTVHVFNSNINLILRTFRFKVTTININWLINSLMKIHVNESSLLAIIIAPTFLSFTSLALAFRGESARISTKR